MPALDDPRWNTLQHAYGPAADTPGLLLSLADGKTSPEQREALWSSLWHQGSVYTASYAAVPHIIDALPRVPLGDRLNLLVLATGIVASAAAPSSPPVPPDLKPELEAALDRAKPIIAAMLFARPWDDYELRYLLGTVAIALGRPKCGLELQELDLLACPQCGAEIDVAAHLGIESR